MKAFRKLLMLSLVTGVCGCAAVNNTMQSWVGHPQSELIASWGPPNSTAPDGNGGQILIYQNFLSTGQTPGYITPVGYGSYSYTAPQQNGYNRTRMFYADTNGMIYNWRWQGL